MYPDEETIRVDKGRKIVNKVSQIFTAIAILVIALAGPPLQVPAAASAPAYVSHTLNKSSDLRQSATFPHTVPAGDNRLLMVAVMIRADEWVSSVTYSGSSLTLAKVQDGGDSDDQRVELWYLIGPPVGTENNVVVNFASYVNPSGIAAVNFTEVDQSSPIGATAGANATSGIEATTNITTLNDNSLIFGAVSARGADTYWFTPGSGITDVWNEYTDSDSLADDGLWGGRRAAATAGTYTFNATLHADDHWAIACVELGYFSPPSFVSITPDKSSCKDGDTITLTVTLASHNTGCTLTADFSNIDDQYVSGAESVVNWGTDGTDNDGDGHVDNPAEQGVYVISYSISTVNTKSDGTYSIPVTAVDGGGNSNTDNSTSLTLDNTPPSAPTNLSATALSGGGIRLTWTASSPETDVAQYNIYRATTSGGQNYSSPTYTVSSGTTTYTDTATTNGVTYYYVVRAQDAAGNIETNTNEVSATTSGTGPPAPTNLTATAIAGDGIKLTWTASSPETDVAQYNIYQATTSGGEDYSSPTYTVSAGITTYTDTSTTGGQTYYYVVRAQDATGNIETNANEVWATVGVVGPSVGESQIYIKYQGALLYNLASSTNRHNPGVFASGKIDEIYLQVNLLTGAPLNESASSIALYKLVDSETQEVSGSQQINQDTGWAELILHLAPVFDPNVDEHSRNALYWVDASAADTAGSTNDFDFYFIYDTTPPSPPKDIKITSFDSLTSFITVSGRTVPDELSDPQWVEIFINDSSKGTVTADANYEFVKSGIGLIKGTNYIAVQSTDKAGNKSELSKSLKLNYNPEGLLSIVIRSPHVVRSGSSTSPIRIIYSVTQPAEVTIRIFNLRGQIVKEWSGYASPGGEMEWKWYGRNMYEQEVNNGVYIFRIKVKTGGETAASTKLVGVLR